MKNIIKFFLSIISVLFTNVVYAEAKDKNGFDVEKAAETWGGTVKEKSSAEQQTELDDDDDDDDNDDSDKDKGKDKGKSKEKEKENEDKDKEEDDDDDESEESKAQKEKEKGEKAKGEIEIDGTKYTAEEVKSLVEGLDEGETLEIDGKKLNKEQILEKLGVTEAPETVELGKNKLTKDEYAQLLKDAKAKFEWTDEDIKEMSDKTLKKVLTGFLVSENTLKTARENHQENATNRRQIESEMADLVDKVKDVEDREKEVATREKELTELMKKKPEDEEDDIKRNKLISEQTMGEKELRELKTEKDDLLQDKIKFAAQHTALWAETQVNELVTSIPGFMTTKDGNGQSKDLADIYDEFDTKGKYSGDPADLQRAVIATDVLTAYRIYVDNCIQNKRKVSVTISEFYKANPTKFGVLPTAQPVNGDTKNKGKTAKDEAKAIIQKMLKKQAQNPPDPKGGGEDKTGSTASKNKDVEHNRKADNVRKKGGWVGFN